MFAICDGCGTVTEFEDEVVAGRLANWAQAAEFSVAHTAVELRGRCKSCAADAVTDAQ
jgi:Fur family zinc uptake transcriptional regulator